MSLKADKNGNYRVNFYLNPTKNIKDRLIVELLNSKYSANEYVKNLLYEIATGTYTVDNKDHIIPSSLEKEVSADTVEKVYYAEQEEIKEEYEDIKGDIEL